MEQWQLEAIQSLLATETKEVEPGTGGRVYVSSKTYGSSLYHLLDKRDDSVQVEQVDINEKWNKRINIYDDELAEVLKTLLTWYLGDVHEREQQGDVELGDLDDHPF